MKKILSTLMFFATLIFTSEIQAETHKIYVATSGDDLNSGNIGDPLKTFTAAVQQANSEIGNHPEGIEIVMGSGIYDEAAPAVPPLPTDPYESTFQYILWALEDNISVTGMGREGPDRTEIRCAIDPPDPKHVILLLQPGNNAVIQNLSFISSAFPGGNDLGTEGGAVAAIGCVAGAPSVFGGRVPHLQNSRHVKLLNLNIESEDVAIGILGDTFDTINTSYDGQKLVVTAVNCTIRVGIDAVISHSRSSVINLLGCDVRAYGQGVRSPSGGFQNPPNSATDPSNHSPRSLVLTTVNQGLAAYGGITGEHPCIYAHDCFLASLDQPNRSIPFPDNQTGYVAGLDKIEASEGGGTIRMSNCTLQTLVTTEVVHFLVLDTTDSAPGEGIIYVDCKFKEGPYYDQVGLFAIDVAPKIHTPQGNPENEAFHELPLIYSASQAFGQSGDDWANATTLENALILAADLTTYPRGAGIKLAPPPWGNYTASSDLVIPNNVFLLGDRSDWVSIDLQSYAISAGDHSILKGLSIFGENLAAVHLTGSATAPVYLDDVVVSGVALCLDASDSAESGSYIGLLESQIGRKEFDAEIIDDY